MFASLRRATGLAKQICKPSLFESARGYRPVPAYRPAPNQLSFGAYQPPASSTWKPVAFCFAGSAAAFTGAAVYDEWERQKLRPHQGTWRGSNLLSRLDGTPQLPDWEVALLRRLPEPVRVRAIRLLLQWHLLRPSERVVYGLIGVNTAVFLAWQIPRLNGFMRRYFLQALPPVPNNPITLLTTTFSHQSLVHFAVNMFVLRSFGVLACHDLGTPQFLAFYLSAGMFSSLAAHLGRLRSLRGGYSLGASGAIFACFALAAVHHPNLKGYILFLPGIPLEVGQIFYAALAFDAIGAWQGWRYLDHYGHLGGAMFGWVYAKYGEQYIWGRRDKLLHALGLK